MADWLSAFCRLLRIGDDGKERGIAAIQYSFNKNSRASGLRPVTVDDADNFFIIQNSGPGNQISGGAGRKIFPGFPDGPQILPAVAERIVRLANGNEIFDALENGMLLVKETEKGHKL